MKNSILFSIFLVTFHFVRLGAQNPILRSSTSTAPTQLTQIVPSVLTQSGNFIGIGTNSPTQRLTLRGHAAPNPILIYDFPPIIRFEYATPNIGIAGNPFNWHLIGGSSFMLTNINTGISPIVISQESKIMFNSPELSLNVIGGNSGNNNKNKIILAASNLSERLISWSAYSNGVNNNTIPLDFTFDVQGTGATDVTVMRLMPTGFVGIGNANPIEKLHLQNGNFKISNGNIMLDGGRLLIQNSTGLGSGLNQIALNSDGTIRAREIIVDLQTIPDYVFNDDYPLLSLSELKEYIQKNKHLPGIKSETEYKQEGEIKLTELNLKLLEKIEELTLYIIEINEELEKLKASKKKK